MIAVSTRAAVHSLSVGDPQVRDVLMRGRTLLDGLEPLVLEHPSDDVRRAFAQAREEVGSLDRQLGT